MKWTAADHQYMARALLLARRGRYSTHPNPRVGCVLVRNNEIVGQGWHRYAGSAHAEREALDEASDRADGATCYVTLEPCNHHGKTPPCTDALIESGISRLVAAMQDPDPRTVGKGLQRLRDTGVEVETGLMENQASRLNRGFIKRMTRGLPWVTCKIAASIDGRTAMPDGESKWITSEAARRDVQRLRAASSAVLSGIGTILADDPGLDVREETAGFRPPLRVILDRELRFPVEAKTLSLPGRVLIFTCSDDARRIAVLQEAGAEVVVKERLAFLSSVLQHLAIQEEVNDVLVEAGSTLTGALLTGGHIDEVILYQAMIVMGDNAAGLFHLPWLQKMQDRLEMKLSRVRRIGTDIRLELGIVSTGSGRCD